MLSTAEGSMRSTNETNGLLNNNTVDAIKLNEPTAVSAASVLETFDEAAAQKLMAQTESIVAVDSSLLLAAPAPASEGSAKATGTWCPPIHSATHLSEINGKKVVKAPAKDDQAQVERKESESIRLAERVVRAPCVKLEPQDASGANASKMANILPLLATANDGLQFMKIKPEPPSSMTGESSNPDSQPSVESKEKLSTSSSVSTSQKKAPVSEPVGVTSTKVKSSEPSNSNLVSTALLQVTPSIVQTTAPPLPDLSPSPITAATKGDIDLIKTIASSPSNQTRRPCNCTRSSCLKLYCECFAQGITCNGCNCTNCHNNGEHMEERNRAIKLILDRNPCAFQSKIRKQYGHVKGCNCKKSNCLKNYCECYEAKILCTSLCRCFGCQNSDLSAVPTQVSFDFLKKSVIMPKPESQLDSPAAVTGAPSPSTSAPDYPAVDPIALANSAKLQIAARLSAKIENEGNGEVQLRLSQTPPVKKRIPTRRPRTSCPPLPGRAIAPSVSTVVTAAVANTSSPPLPALAPSPALPSATTAVTLVSTTAALPSPAAVAVPSGSSTISPPECPALVPAPSKAAADAAAAAAAAAATASDGGSNNGNTMDSLTETINEVVAAARRSVGEPGALSKVNSVRRPASNSPSSNPKRARVTVDNPLQFVADGSSVYSPDSTCLTLPVIGEQQQQQQQQQQPDDVSSEASAGPREDEFTAEELAMMQRIRQRAVHSTDASTIASNSTTVNDGANMGSPAPPGGDSPLSLEPCPNGVLEAADARRECDPGLGALSIDLPVSSETPARLQTTSAVEENSASGAGGGDVALDPETPKNILSFLHTSQQQIESALGANVSPVTLTTAPGGPTNLLYTILSANSAQAGSPQTLIPIATKTANSAAAVVGAMSFRPCVHNANSGVVHWRPQQQQQQQQQPQQQQQQPQQQQQQQHQGSGITSPIIPTIVAAANPASEPPSAPLKVTIAPAAAQPAASPTPTTAANGPTTTTTTTTTLSQLTALVSGENGLRAQVQSLQRQVSVMQRSQLRQTRLLAAIHRTLMRRDATHRRRLQLQRFAAKARSTALERAKRKAAMDAEAV